MALFVIIIQVSWGRGKWEILRLELRAEIKLVCLAFLASVLTITPSRLPDDITVPNAYLSIRLLAGEVGADYYTMYLTMKFVCCVLHRSNI